MINIVKKLFSWFQNQQHTRFTLTADHQEAAPNIPYPRTYHMYLSTSKP